MENKDKEPIIVTDQPPAYYADNPQFSQQYIDNPLVYPGPRAPLMVIGAPPLTDPPKDYLCCSIFVLICCCWPIGIFAVLKSVATRDAINRGNQAAAYKNSNAAKNCCIGAVICGIIIMALLAVRVVLMLQQSQGLRDELNSKLNSNGLN